MSVSDQLVATKSIFLMILMEQSWLKWSIVSDPSKELQYLFNYLSTILEWEGQYMAQGSAMVSPWVLGFMLPRSMALGKLFHFAKSHVPHL